MANANSIKVIRTNRGPKPANKTGQVFGRWTVLSISGIINGRGMWLCRCECGVIKQVRGDGLIDGSSASCGCFAKEQVSKASKKHGHGWPKQSPEYKAWQHMKYRCENQNCPEWFNYGGRGISVCAEWANSFETFYAETGPRPSNRHTLDRYPDNNGNYEPANVRWATRHQQMQNVRHNVLITHNNETLCISEWSRRVGIAVNTIAYRLRVGWPVAIALSKRGRKS